MTKGNKALWAVAALLALNVVLVGAQLAGAALPRGIGNYFMGPKLVRAEVLVMDGSLREFRIDRGAIRDRPVAGSLTLRERDGTVVTLPVAPDVTVMYRNRTVSFERLRRGMNALVIREGDGPVIEIRVG
jgi:hypothetical protein